MDYLLILQVFSSVEVTFDAMVDHLASTHIIRSKSEPATTRIKGLLEVLSSYTFSLYYLKGKDMNVTDFFSRMEGDKSDPLGLF